MEKGPSRCSIVGRSRPAFFFGRGTNTGVEAYVVFAASSIANDRLVLTALLVTSSFFRRADQVYVHDEGVSELQAIEWSCINSGMDGSHFCHAVHTLADICSFRIVAVQFLTSPAKLLDDPQSSSTGFLNTGVVADETQRKCISVLGNPDNLWSRWYLYVLFSLFFLRSSMEI